MSERPQAIEAQILSGLDEALGGLPGGEHATVRAHRRCAAECFATTGWPARHHETWKYTDASRIRALLSERLWHVPSPAPQDTGAIERALIPDLDAYQLVFVGGFLHRSLSHIPEGVTVRSLTDMLHDGEEAALDALAVDAESVLFNGFVALNAAMATDGAVVSVADGVSLEKPLYLVHLPAGNGRAEHVRHHVVLGRGAKAVVIEHFAGLDGSTGLTNSVSRVELHDNASLEHYRLQLEADTRFHVGRIEVVQHRDSRYVSHAVALGSALSRVDLVSQLKGQGAECTMNGLYLLGGRQHADHHTYIDHATPHGRSRENYRGVLAGRAHGVFNGKIVVSEGAVKTDSEQSNANLLLSDDAEVDTKPELEIYNDDVKCAHGATVGQMDTTQLFYLRSRGLAEDAARNMLTFAFADEVLASIGLDRVRTFLEREALKRLPGGSTMEGLV
ncbi:MAG TPA: Fe-S cluster assembly protein SufD [Mariprofundaceae bacterium]|nr:Fe-S cluster assembly protein SufD [Mariprofundaceae bacterium]